MADSEKRTCKLGMKKIVKNKTVRRNKLFSPPTKKVINEKT